ncbi:MAG: helix-turn-helix domain-containing protein [Burkholderiaceae bacterium]|nr:helix-turn-helix domain-containing protein [Burkholderiaceae bacterium]
MPPPEQDSSNTLLDEARYAALRARDARFDGNFFTGVTSTGIYCRPVCKVRVPRRENCRFFTLAAQAEQAGFRPCLRCRPELAPGGVAWSLQDASAILAHQAARLLDDPAAWPEAAPSMTALAARLGVSDRHLRRIFEAHLGVSPLAYLQTRRLLSAKQLLTDTDLPVTRIALASGFRSLRRFNSAFQSHYRLNPTRLRREGAAREGQGLSVRLAWRPPLDVDALLAFFASRLVEGVEAVSAGGPAPTYARTIALSSDGRMHTGWMLARFDASRNGVTLQVSDSLAEVLPLVIARVRALFDLDADPAVINACLSQAATVADSGFALDKRLKGLRVPGCIDGFELAVRAVLGQQITVAAARTLARRLTQRFGDPVHTGMPGLDRLFPSAAALARATVDSLGELGIVRQRQQAILALARAVADGQLVLGSAADVGAACAALKALPGIGEWTAQYIAMRVLRDPDAFPAGDVALQRALGVTSAKEAERLSQVWRPWRSYAVLRIWQQGPLSKAPKNPETIASTD